MKKLFNKSGQCSLHIQLAVCITEQSEMTHGVYFPLVCMCSSYSHIVNLTANMTVTHLSPLLCGCYSDYDVIIHDKFSMLSTLGILFCWAYEKPKGKSSKHLYFIFDLRKLGLKRKKSYADNFMKILLFLLQNNEARLWFQSWL